MDYYITYDISIISLIFVALFLPKTIIAIIFIDIHYCTDHFIHLLLQLLLLSHYYLHYFLPRLLLLLSLSISIILIICFPKYHIHYGSYDNNKKRNNGYN
jgi:hypothetical protein